MKNKLVILYLIFAKRAMPPGMLQQMQRQMRSGGMQEMMKAMMQGQGGDQFDMEEMQSLWIPLKLILLFTFFFIAEMMASMGGGGLGGLGGLAGLGGGGMPGMADMMKMMGMGGGH